MVYATVKDGYSREHDPHLHTHCVLMNITQWQDKFMGIWTRKNSTKKIFNKNVWTPYIEASLQKN